MYVYIVSKTPEKYEKLVILRSPTARKNRKEKKNGFRIQMNGWIFSLSICLSARLFKERQKCLFTTCSISPPHVTQHREGHQVGTASTGPPATASFSASRCLFSASRCLFRRLLRHRKRQWEALKGQCQLNCERYV